jgi:hypothetical protein
MRLHDLCRPSQCPLHPVCPLAFCGVAGVHPHMGEGRKVFRREAQQNLDPFLKSWNFALWTLALSTSRWVSTRWCRFRPLTFRERLLSRRLGEESPSSALAPSGRVPLLWPGCCAMRSGTGALSRESAPVSSTLQLEGPFPSGLEGAAHNVQLFIAHHSLLPATPVGVGRRYKCCRPARRCWGRS